MWTGIGIAAGAIGGALLSSNASDKASNAQSASAGQSIAEQRRQYDQARADNAQFLTTGTAANRRLASLLGLSGGVDETDPRFQEIKKRIVSENDQLHQDKFGMSIFDPRSALYTINGAKDRWDQMIQDEARKQYTAQNGTTAPTSSEESPLLRKFGQSDLDADPVYQSGLKFGADQGRDAINARATAGGMYDSGATLKALTRFGNDYGSTKANESYNRFTNDQNNIFNRLSGISGTGQVATGQVSAAGSNMANNVGAAYEGAGNARAAGIVGGANAWGGAINNAYMGYNNYQSNQRLDALLRRYPGAGGSSAPTATPDYYYGSE